jgi:hypothetical protein
MAGELASPGRCRLLFSPRHVPSGDRSPSVYCDTPNSFLDGGGAPFQASSAATRVRHQPKSARGIGGQRD